ncbi:MAG TPA: hypothetical protein VHA30_04520, partial [Patescibacteria group bacterium]|nr:hypothetical protein [Patescibacteria group bacterium]
MGKNFSWRRVGKVVLAIVVLGALAAGLWLLISWRPVRIIWAAEARNRIENFLPCEDLPFYVQVEKGLGQHQDAVARLKQLGAQSVSVRQVDCRVEDGGYE